jgi:hypothetical protein
MRRLRCLLAPLLLLVVHGCASVDATRPREHLDRRTGATLTVTAQPWVFARDQPQLAAHGRDYLSIHAVEVNVGGRLAHYLAVFDWSTVDRRQRPATRAQRLRLLLDDRQWVLEGQGVEPRAAGIADWPLKAPGRGARLRVYPADVELLRYWLKAGEVRLRSEGDPEDPDARFDSWRDGRAALAALVGGDASR